MISCCPRATTGRAHNHQWHAAPGQPREAVSFPALDGPQAPLSTPLHGTVHQVCRTAAPKKLCIYVMQKSGNEPGCSGKREGQLCSYMRGMKRRSSSHSNSSNEYMCIAHVHEAPHACALLSHAPAIWGQILNLQRRGGGDTTRVRQGLGGCT